MSEQIILTNLLKSEEYARKVLPFLHISYFSEQPEKLIFTSIVKHYDKYNTLPSKTEVEHFVNEREDLSQDQVNQTLEYLETLSPRDKPDPQWLIDTTEQFCQDRAIYNAIMDSISIIDGGDQKRTKHAIPDILKDALSISFDTHIGHDYFEDAASRFDYYNLEEERLPFDLDMFNKITNNGVPNKTLNCILAGTNVGKSLFLVHMAASYMMQGKNVLYITLEMAEEAISNRIDANLMNIPVNALESLEKDKFFSRIDKLKAKTQGKLIVKEYPTSSAHVGHFKQLLQELRLKKRFKPDVIMVDYINIMASSRTKMSTAGSYFYIKAIAEELRGLAVEQNVPIWSATQSNRSGQSDSDVDLTNTSESFGLPATVDFMFAVIRTDELDNLNQVLVKQLKSRYGNKTFHEKFVIGIDVEKMKLYDVESSAQTVMQSNGDKGPTDKPTKKKMSGLKI
jgi:replicative DNA helicase